VPNRISIKSRLHSTSGKIKGLKKYQNIYFRKFFAHSILSVGVVLVLQRQIVQTYNGGHNWAFGEWLINYGGGLVRRGLFGEVILSFPLNGKAILWAVLFFQLMIYLTIIVFLRIKLKSQNYSWYSILIVCNPAGMLLLSWDQNLFIRKELLGIVILILFLYVMEINRFQNFLVLALVSLNFLAILTSEVNLFFYPTILYFLLKNEILNSFYKKLCIIYLSVGNFILLLFVAKYHGNLLIANKICHKLVLNGLDPNLNCRGAIDILALNLNTAITHLKNDFPGNFLYLIPLVLSIIPFVLGGWLKNNILIFSAVLLGVLPLFFIAWDFGRWIFIINMSLTFIFLSSKPTEVLISSKQAIVIVLYVVFFGFGHGGNPISNGWISAFATILRLIVNF